MVELSEDDDCECEDTPLIVYCNKCGRIHVVANEKERIQLTSQNRNRLRKILKSELKENISWFVEGEEFEDGY